MLKGTLEWRDQVLFSSSQSSPHRLKTLLTSGIETTIQQYKPEDITIDDILVEVRSKKMYVTHCTDKEGEISFCPFPHHESLMDVDGTSS